MPNSRVPSAYAELLTRFTAAVEAAADGADRQVIDGAQLDGDEAADRLYVGWSGDPGDRVAVEFTRAWRGIGAGRQTETFTIRCAVVSTSGDDDEDALADLRARAFDTLALAETAVRPADKSLGLPAPTVFLLDAGQLLQDTPQRVRIPFTVQVTTRI